MKKFKIILIYFMNTLQIFQAIVIIMIFKSENVLIAHIINVDF